jgi:hypothetical protein
VKEVHGAGQQHVRNVWSNVAYLYLCLWLHTIVELWSWRRSGTTLRSRDDRPWDDLSRRPSRADRLNTLRKQVFQETFSALPRSQRAARKIRNLWSGLTWTHRTRYIAYFDVRKCKSGCVLLFIFFELLRFRFGFGTPIAVPKKVPTKPKCGAE